MCREPLHANGVEDHWHAARIGQRGYVVHEKVEVLPMELHQPSAGENDHVRFEELFAFAGGISAVDGGFVPLPPEIAAEPNAFLNYARRLPEIAKRKRLDSAAATPAVSLVGTNVHWHDLHVVSPEVPQDAPDKIVRGIEDHMIAEVGHLQIAQSQFHRHQPAPSGVCPASARSAGRTIFFAMNSSDRDTCPFSPPLTRP